MEGRKQVDFSSLVPDTKLKIYSYLQSKDLQNISLINIQENKQSHTIFKDKLKTKFNIKLSENYNPKMWYINISNKIKTEKELFIKYSLYKVTLYNTWLKCIVSENSFDSFSDEAILVQQKMNPTQLKTDTQKYTTLFNRAINSPSSLSEDELQEILINLCRINAYGSIQVFFKKHPQFLDGKTHFSTNLPIDLLREAISCLHVKTVESLLNLYNYKNKYLLHDYDGMGMSFFCSPLFFALNLPAVTQCLVNQAHQLITVDHPKLTKIIKLILSFGIDPNQNCILAPLVSFEQKTLRQNAEIHDPEIINFPIEQIEEDYKEILVKATRSISKPNYINLEINNNCIGLVRYFKIKSIKNELREEYLTLLSDILNNKIPQNEKENTEKNANTNDYSMNIFRM